MHVHEWNIQDKGVKVIHEPTAEKRHLDSWIINLNGDTIILMVVTKRSFYMFLQAEAVEASRQKLLKFICKQTVLSTLLTSKTLRFMENEAISI